MRRPKFIGVIAIPLGIVFIAIVGLLTSTLWNALVPPIFGLREISVWQALGLLLLSRLLFGRYGGWGHRIRKARFVRGLKDLTPEERERFRSAMLKRAGGCGGGEEPEKA